MAGNDHLSQAVEFLTKQVITRPQTVIVLGSGLSGIAGRIENPTIVPFGDIPGFVVSTASGNRGELIFGSIAGKDVVAMSGRLHRYEGWTNNQVTFPLRVLASLGADQLIVSNAAGGLNPKLSVGDIVVIRDHINWMYEHTSHPKIDGNQELSASVPRCFGDVYDDSMAQIALKTGVENSFAVVEGTYLATLGPNYETRAEVRMMRRLGVDVVGMSTVPEVLIATTLRMRTLGLSMVSNIANPDRPIVANHEEVLDAGKRAAVKMEAIVERVIRCS